MIIQTISDLHLEFGLIKELYEEMIEAPADILVLAGDISTPDYAIEHINKIQKDSGKRLIVVPGNHDYYGRTRKSFDAELETLQAINNKIHVLVEGTVFMDGIAFLGSTGWWDGSNGHIGSTVINGLNDFRAIYDLMDNENLDGKVWGRKSKLFFEHKMDFIRKNFPNTKIVCVSHHYPHYRSLDPRFAGSPLNACFGNRWEYMIDKYQPELWVHGHTHTSFDYMVGKTRMVCNPQGYPEKYALSREQIMEEAKNRSIEISDDGSYQILMGTENRGYDPAKTVEV